MMQIYESRPTDFTPDLEVVACFVESQDRILFLKKSKGFPQELLWGLPGGKVEKGEKLHLAIKRELFEETGIQTDEKQLSKIQTLYVQKPEIQFSFHLYHLEVKQEPSVQLSEEHSEFCWKRLEESHSLSFMEGEKVVFFQYMKHKAKAKTRINVYLILQNQNEILLHLRQNTGYLDGYYGLVSGHVEEGESATDAIIRETFEESNLTLDPKDLKVVHVMHRKTNRSNIDIFFSCKKWKGQLENKEPHKCAQLQFFPFTSLPANAVAYVVAVLQSLETKYFSEMGWKDA